MSGVNIPPSVTALLPAWNSEAFIRPTLASLAAQDYANFRVFISDDASSDATKEICREFAQRHANFSYMRQPQRLGWIGNVNALLSAAQADYFFFAFHDDPVEPTYVSRLAAALTANPQATLAFSDVMLARENALLEDKSYDILENVSSRLERGIRIVEKRGLWWIPNRGLFRAETARLVGGLKRHPAGEYSADLPWLLHFALRGEFVRVPQALIRKTWRKQGLSLSWRGTMWQSFGLAVACARAINQSGISSTERRKLLRALVMHEVKSQWWRLNGR